MGESSVTSEEKIDWELYTLFSIWKGITSANMNEASENASYCAHIASAREQYAFCSHSSSEYKTY